MSKQFKKGQKVRAIRNTTSRYGLDFYKGDLAVVSDPDWSGRAPHTLGLVRAGGMDTDARLARGSIDWYVKPEDFEVVPETTTESVMVHRMSEFKVGDVVTKEGGYGDPVRVDREPGVKHDPGPGVFGTAVVNGVRHGGFTVDLDDEGGSGFRYLNSANRSAFTSNFTDFEPGV